MYVITSVYLGDDEYEVGADVDYDEGDRYQSPSHQVGEPDISAPNCRLKHSRIADERTLPDGWSEIVEEALVAAHEGAIGDMLDSAADYAYDMSREDW